MKSYIKNLKLFILMLAVTLCFTVSSSAFAKSRPNISIRGILSNGEVFEGVLQRDSGIRLTIKAASGYEYVPTANIVSADIYTTSSLQEELPQDPRIAMGKYLLQRNMNWLAEQTFTSALLEPEKISEEVKLQVALNETLIELPEIETLQQKTILDQIQNSYSSANKQLPVQFGGTKKPYNIPRLYQLPTENQVVDNLTKTQSWGEAMTSIADTTHAIETDHFIIYSNLHKRDDGHIRVMFEKLYREMTSQFSIPETEHVWAGKLPVFAFAKRENFEKFCVDTVKLSKEVAKKSGGYAGWQGSFNFILLSPMNRPGISKAKVRSNFYELLVHETTHAFIARYINTNNLPSWLDEGIAELIASKLVKNSHAMSRLKKAHQLVKKPDAPEVEKILQADSIKIAGEHYGIAHSITRYLIKTDRAAFTEMVRLIKSGTSSEIALKSAFGVTYEQLNSQWKSKVRS